MERHRDQPGSFSRRLRWWATARRPFSMKIRSSPLAKVNKSERSPSFILDSAFFSIRRFGSLALTGTPPLMNVLESLNLSSPFFSFFISHIFYLAKATTGPRPFAINPILCVFKSKMTI